MKFYTFVFAKGDDGVPTAQLSVRADGFVRMPGGHEMLPELVQVGEGIRATPHPRSVQTVIEILVEDRTEE